MCGYKDSPDEFQIFSVLIGAFCISDIDFYAPPRSTHRSCGSSALADGRRKVKNALYYSVFKERAEAIEKAPSLFQPKKQGGYNRIF